MSKQSTESIKDAEQRRICQGLCEARCCRYITIHIDAPRLKADFDEISWFLAHENISVYFHGRRWHVEVRNRCKYLTRNNLCSAYESRPLVCRGYDTEECEYPARPKHDLEFDSTEQFDAWWTKKKERQRKRRRRRAQAAKSS